MNRPICKVKGCNKQATIKRKYFHHKEWNYEKQAYVRYVNIDNSPCKITYYPFCSKHLKHCSTNKIVMCEKMRLRDKACTICSWNRTSCDIHRITPGAEGGKYTTDNVIVLCPNCHRLAGKGIISREDLLKYLEESYDRQEDYNL